MDFNKLDTPEIEDIMTYVSHRLPHVIRAEVIKWSKHDEEIQIVVVHNKEQLGGSRRYDPKSIQHTMMGYNTTREIHIDMVIKEIERFKSGL